MDWEAGVGPQMDTSLCIPWVASVGAPFDGATCLVVDGTPPTTVRVWARVLQDMAGSREGWTASLSLYVSLAPLLANPRAVWGRTTASVAPVVDLTYVAVHPHVPLSVNAMTPLGVSLKDVAQHYGHGFDVYKSAAFSAYRLLAMLDLLRRTGVAHGDTHTGNFVAYPNRPTLVRLPTGAAVVLRDMLSFIDFDIADMASDDGWTTASIDAFIIAVARSEMHGATDPAVMAALGHMGTNREHAVELMGTIVAQACNILVAAAEDSQWVRMPTAGEQYACDVSWRYMHDPHEAVSWNGFVRTHQHELARCLAPMADENKTDRPVALNIRL